ncbi:MAG: divalent-cation tolerance protein CutA [Candidatus Syntrophonatronum acetioxidans]|uniref:Divalent-cation tolerance protein CutA n=1 Tax=Candidatus Syntrophonatronum acetioxidans TaxID=1795816 RepID=A0A424YAF8_9FIRM|nr:MAG: divalent-cation tolerance protein CutA [Candidatus Syntrophonatronum acetioxidans]
MSRSMFYITAGDAKEGEKIAKILIEKRLAACVNVFPSIKSFFYWEGEAQSEEEVLLVGKTRTLLLDKLEATVKENHSYDMPCIVTWKLEGGSQEFLEWIDQETKKG